MTKFLFIRISCLSVLLAVIAFILFGKNPVIAAGIIIGGLLSAYKIRLQSVFLQYVTQTEGSTFLKSVMLNLFLQVMTMAVLMAAVFIDVRFFYAISAGLLVAAAFISLNGFTEKIGLTHNNWQS